MAQLIVLLPTRNEEEGLSEVIERIPERTIIERGFNLRVIVVDGFSSDSTCEIAKSKGVELIHQSGETGKGTGVRQALGAILAEKTGEGDLLVMLDADATYHPEDILEFLTNLEDNDVVWGSRLRGKMERGAMTITNRIGNIFLSFMASIVYFKRTTDLCTGYWGFRLNSLRGIALTAVGFNLEADLFSSVCKKKMKTKEIVIDYDHREGQSNLKWYIDGPRILFMILKKRITR